jgi:RecJ-like exonuclease
MNSVGLCPVCDGDGLEAVEVFKSQSFSRDTGEPYEELRHCETCDGSGEVMLEDE